MLRGEILARNRLVFVATLGVLLLTEGCGKKMDQEASTSSDSLLASNPVESTAPPPVSETPTPVPPVSEGHSPSPVSLPHPSPGDDVDGVLSGLRRAQIAFNTPSTMK